uniref:Thyrotropin-releasing hormone receptor n=1 Tax=Capra hircus TaxID=9925 RepID=A0A8C2RSF1_CAPHI
ARVPAMTSLLHHPAVLGPAYKVVSVFLVLLLVCVVGITGNAMVVLVVLTTRDMHKPTSCYMVSLALADLTSLAGQWYLGINASSCSILALTVERYVAICNPMRAQTMCTMALAKRVAVGVWGTTSMYCLLWFFLVDLDAGGCRGLQCSYWVARSLYLPIYLLDFTVFFLTLLLAATVLYGLIARILFQSALEHLPQLGDQRRDSEAQPEARLSPTRPSRPRATAMLVVVVLLFAVLWIPYQTLVLLSSFVPFLDPWVLLFCLICACANSAIHPIIYSLMSQKFQAAFRRLCQCRAKGPQRLAAGLSTASYSVVRETPQKLCP